LTIYPAALGILPLAQAAPPPGWTITRLTVNDYDDEYPQISGTNVAWAGDDGNDSEIFLYDGNTITQLTDNSYNDLSPRISGSNVVWKGRPGSGYEIFYYDGNTTTYLSDSSTYNEGPQISGSNVVWYGKGSGFFDEIFYYDGNTVTQITDNSYHDQSPKISGSNIVWQGKIGSDYDIFYYDGETITQLTDNSYDDGSPQISGTNIVWQGYDGNDHEIFYYNGSTITQLTDNDYDDQGPQISGSNVVWYGGMGSSYNWEIYFWNGTTTIQLTDNEYLDSHPQISGSNVVWFGGPRARAYEIYFYNGNTITQLTKDSGMSYLDQYPQISGSNVVWQRWDDNNIFEIFMATLTPQDFLVQGDPVKVAEGGTGTFTVALAIDPIVPINVTVACESGDADISVQSEGTLGFNSSNFSQPQLVTLAAAEDADNITGLAAIRISAIDIPSYDVTAIEADNDRVPGIVFVDKDATGANTGMSWSDAYNYLQFALLTAQSGDEIRVAKGIYKPDRDLTHPNGNGNRFATFQLVDGVAIKGGYAGFGEPYPDVRDLELYETILSGDLNGNDFGEMDHPSRDENSYHVLIASGTTLLTVLDGLTIMAGRANGSLEIDQMYRQGGAMYNDSGSPTVINCTFSGNWPGIYNIFSSLEVTNCTFTQNASGPAMFNGGSGNPVLTNCNFTGNTGRGMYNSHVSTTLTNCTFTGNTGGGMDNTDCTPELTNCTFRGNYAGSGGGMFNRNNSNTILTDCTFSGNSAETYGGGMYNAVGSNPVMTNCTFTGNSVQDGYGGGIYNNDCSPTLTNCIISNNLAQVGGGIVNNGYNINTVLTNCVLIGNLSVKSGGAMYNWGADSVLTNCILWDNISDQGKQISLINRSTVSLSYCDIQSGQTDIYVGINCSFDWGAGNIDLKQYLTPDGHLQTGPPCIDAGTGSGAPSTDFDGEPRPSGSGVDIGADEFIDTDGDGLPDWLENAISGSPTAADPGGDPDLDGLTNLEEYELYSSNPNATPIYVDIDNQGDPGEDGSFAHPFDTIKEGIDAAGDGDTVLVAEGTYLGINNRDLDFNGKPMVLRAMNGPTDTTINCEGLGRGFDFHLGEGPTTVVEGFTITNGQADYGGAIRCRQSSPQIRNCIITGNTATEQGGGIYCYLSMPTFVDCNITNNIPDGIWMEYGSARIEGIVELSSNDWDSNDVMLYGDGEIKMDSTVTLDLINTRIRCDIFGPGTVQVDPESELIIEKDAIINLYNDADPNQNGQIQCEGLLLVRDSVHFSNANVQVKRLSFEGDVDISNNIITAEAGSPYGQFFIEDTVHIVDNDIHADGDRYMDLDPSVFAGVIANNRIFVTITEGIGNTRGGLLELRGSDGLAGNSYCDPNNEFFCEVNDVPPQDTNSWTLEQLKLVTGAKVNLTNRFDFGNGGLYEVMYVKDLILEPNSVLNTAFNKLYYQNLIGDLNSVRNEPLLGFSLSNIALNNNNEFLTRVMHNNYTHPENHAYDRTHVKRIDGNEPDPNGMMRMCNLEELDPCSPNYGQVINARAKGLFAKASEDEILIRFEYLFGSSDPNVELVIYLSDVPELLAHNDPCRLDHYIEVARLYPPPAGQYGSAGSDHLGIFEKVVSAGNLNFIRGVRMELELAGPDGTCILINNWDPYVSCIYCGDVTGDFGVTPRDYLTVLGESGELSSGLSGLGLALDCLEKFGFSEDGFLDATDLMGWDWGEWLASEGLVDDLCFTIFLIPPDFNESSGSEALLFGATSTIAPEAGGATGYPGSLLIGGKRFDAVYEDFLSDRLYNFDESYNLVGGPYALPTDRVNGKLVRDHNDLLYQINVEEGLVRFSDLSSVIPRGQGYSVISEPRYEKAATVYVGFQDQGENTWGRPILDAAFDSQGNVYVTPVVVVHDVCDAYIASAKLMLAPGQSPPYNVVTIYDDPPLPNNNQNCNNLCEIEVDVYGNVYVINSGYANGSDILWLYDSNGVVRKCGLQSLGIYGPVGLCCSGYDNSMLYVASSKGEPDAKSASLYALSTVDLTLVQSVTINNMGHITDITEDPNTGTVWVTGFTMPQYVNYFPAALAEIPQFYYPYLAAVPYGSSGPVRAIQLSNAADLALPLSIAWVGPIPGKCGGADLDRLGDVSFGDLVILVSQWLQPPDTPSADIAPKPNGDGIVNFLDLAVLAEHWMESCAP